MKLDEQRPNNLLSMLTLRVAVLCSSPATGSTWRILYLSEKCEKSVKTLCFSHFLPDISFQIAEIVIKFF